MRGAPDPLIHDWKTLSMLPAGAETFDTQRSSYPCERGKTKESGCSKIQLTCSQLGMRARNALLPKEKLQIRSGLQIVFSLVKSALFSLVTRGQLNSAICGTPFNANLLEKPSYVMEKDGNGRFIVEILIRDDYLTS